MEVVSKMEHLLTESFRPGAHQLDIEAEVLDRFGQHAVIGKDAQIPATEHGSRGG
jgi:hypothetical protein